MFENLTEARKELEPKLFREFHRAAVKAVEGLKLNEVIVIKALQDVDESFTYRYLGYNSLKAYCIEALGLSEPQAGIYISVARKAKNLPSLHPKAVGPEKVRYLTDTVMEMQIAVSEEEFELLTRSQEIISQKARRPVTLREVIKIIALEYNEKHDPLEREKRRQNKSAKKAKTPSDVNIEVQKDGPGSVNEPVVQKSTMRKPLKRTLIDKVLSRDGGRCTYGMGNKQCNQRVFLHVHHIEPKENGGTDEFSNLQTLCSGHHRIVHGDFH